MSRAVPKIGEKVVIYSVCPCGAEQNFAHGVFFRLAYTTTHQCVQNIKTLFKGNPRVEQHVLAVASCFLAVSQWRCN